MIFSVDKGLETATKVDEGKFVDLNIWERTHIEEWVRSNPEMLGENLLVLSIEFDRFKTSNDRLDILAVDQSGNLVVIELKRDSFAGYADLQAIRYAAMVSSMTIDVVVPYYVAYQKKYNDTIIVGEDAREQIIDFVDSESFVEFTNKPRIILCSEGFSKELTATVLWLRESDIDISCVKVTPYKLDDRIIIVPKVLIPLEEAEQYLVEVKQKEESRGRISRSPRKRTLKILLENDLIKEGDDILLKSVLPKHVTFKDNDPIFMAKITGKSGQSDSIIWENDGNEYSISRLSWKIFKDQHPEKKDPGGVNGTAHWVNSDGVALWELAERFLNQE
ncbi:MAG: hypothetical protein OCC49_10440 [Fibrobacterales bacterium]